MRHQSPVKWAVASDGCGRVFLALFKVNTGFKGLKLSVICGSCSGVGRLSQRSLWQIQIFGLLWWKIEKDTRAMFLHSVAPLCFSVLRLVKDPHNKQRSYLAYWINRFMLSEWVYVCSPPSAGTADRCVTFNIHCYFLLKDTIHTVLHVPFQICRRQHIVTTQFNAVSAPWCSHGSFRKEMKTNETCQENKLKHVMKRCKWSDKWVNKQGQK